MGFGSYVTQAYEDKNKSATVREDDARNTIVHLPEILVNDPFGFGLANGSVDKEDRFNFGTNFTVGNALQIGGTSALVGYAMCLLVSFACAATSLLLIRDLSTHEKVVFSSIVVLLPFIVQRTVVWDSSMFAFLFAPSIIAVLQKRRGVADSHRQSPVLARR